MRFFPVYQVFDAEKKGNRSCRPLSLPSFELRLFVEEDEAGLLDFLSESGFDVCVETEKAADLKPYGILKRYRLASVFCNYDGLIELSSLDVSRGEMLFKDISRSVKNYLSKSEFNLLSYRYSPENPLIMGIINVTPDSFYSQSRAISIQDALSAAEKMVSEGAHILDVGGMSTRPGSVEISEDEEIQRIKPVIEKIKENFDIPVSADTYRPSVAKKAIEAGANIINDIYGLRQPGMLELCVELDVPVVLMHMKGESPRTMQDNPYYNDVVAEIAAFFSEMIARFVSAGGKIENLILDPGIGFGKRYEDNLDIIANIGAFRSFGLPILSGHSRKSFIGVALDNVPPEERLFGTVAAGSIAVYNGASILRVHDVKAARDSARVASELKKRS